MNRRFFGNTGLRGFSFLLAGFFALAAGGVPLLAQKPALSMLDELDKGRWELRIRGEAGAPQRLCLGDARRFIQLKHAAIPNCERLIVLDSDDAVTIQYTCRGSGYGRTSIRRETARLVQIESQGIADGLPFAFSGEARRVSACSG